MTYSVNNIENNLVHLIGDDESERYIGLSELPFAVSENDILVFNEETGLYEKGDAEKEKRLTANKKRLNNLFRRAN